VLINKMVYGGCPVWSNTGAVDDGKTLAVYAYNPEMVQIKADPTLTTIIQAQINFFGNTQPVAPSNIYFVKYINPKIDLNGQHLFGFSPLRPALRALQVDNANLEAQLFIMQNKGVLGTFLPENMEALEWIQQGADSEDALRNKMSKMLTYTGKDASIQRPYINALMKYISFGMDADQMGLDASHKATKRMICQVYDFPPELLADEGTTFNNKEMAVKYLLTNTTAPHRRSIEDFVNNYLYPRNGITDRVFVMDISEEPEVQEDYGHMAEKMRNAGAFTLNEIREVLKWPKLEGVEGMDVPYISAGLRAVNDEGDLDLGDYD
jgi:phage portal protein BeeE